MHVGSNLLRPYSYFHNPASGTYHFDTDHDVDFTVYFVLDASWFPLLPELFDEIYTLLPVRYWIRLTFFRIPRPIKFLLSPLLILPA